jgi:hypothetical protein
MYSDSVYYFSKWTFLFTSLFIVSFSTGIIYFSLLFYPDAWQYSLLFATPLLFFIFIIPEYLKTFYYLITNRPALILTEDELVDQFKGKQYKWTEIKKIDLILNEGRVPGGYIALLINNSKKIIRIPDIKLKGKKLDILDGLQLFHVKYGAKKETIS